MWCKALNYARGHLLLSDERVTPQQIADYVIERADQNNDDRLSKEEFIEAAVKNPTIRKLVLGTINATRSPFVRRKNNNGNAAACFP